MGEGRPPRPGHRARHALPLGRRQPRARPGRARPAPPPARPGRLHPAGAAPSGARQLLGDVWEWTASGFTPYPGFTAFPYREYSEVFFPAPGTPSPYKVLRGGSFATDPVACRSTFRNWDHPVRRQIFAGFRTCRDAVPADEGRP